MRTGWCSSFCATAYWTGCVSTTSMGCWIRRATCCGLREQAPRPFYLWSRRSSPPTNHLREDWQVTGTTGYEFTNLVLGLAGRSCRRGGVHPLLRRLHRQRRTASPTIVRDCKIRIMRNEMASELNVLARDAARIARQNPHTADFTRNILQRALQEVVACFPVYRTYIDGNAAPSEDDRRDIDWAIAQARRNETDVDPSVFDFLHKLLTARPGGGATQRIQPPRRRALRHAGAAIQRPGDGEGPGGHRVLSLQPLRRAERGRWHPDQFGVSLASFHCINARRAGAVAARDAGHLDA